MDTTTRDGAFATLRTANAFHAIAGARPVVTLADELARLTDSQPAPLAIVCAWCPTYDKTDPANRGISHTICPSCSRLMEAEMDAREVHA